MKIVIALDSFKSSISAVNACEIIKCTLESINPDFEIISIPMADGGEGTAEAMMAARNGTLVEIKAMGPLPEMKIDAGFVFFPDTKTALVEMARASGLELLNSNQLNPMKTTTYGTGQLIRDAADYGAEKILLAVGGSATVDGGVGAAQALGWKFLDSEGNEIGLGGGELEKISLITRPIKLDLPEIEVLCDVENPLCGENGAARVFAPQKGATPEMVERLEAGLSHLAEVVKQQLDIEIDKVPGAGASGGLPAGAIAFMYAGLLSGIETVIKESRLDKRIGGADWVITGEGQFDDQSLRGKVVAGILKTAAQNHVKTAVIAGRVALPVERWKEVGVADAIALSDEKMSIEDSIANVEALLVEAAKKFAQAHLQ